MGTRNIVAVMVGGEYKVAQYGQWDGYPSGQGVTALEILRNVDLDKFAEAARNCTEESDEMYSAKWLEYGVNLDENDGLVPYDLSELFSEKYPEFNRSTGAEILQIVYDRNGCSLKNGIDFVNDSLFCEWAYVIDLDKRTFEVFQGFNKELLAEGERFYSEELDDNGYSPVTKIKSYSLEWLPTKETFLADLHVNEFGEDEDEECEDEE